MAKLPSYLAMHVPLLDLSEQYRVLGDSIRQTANDVLASGRFILGPKVKAFERAMCAYCSAPHAVGVSSGTDALLAILMARDHFSPTSILRPTTFGHPRFRSASKKIVGLIRTARGKQRTEKKSAQWFRCICLVCAARWTRSVKLRSATGLF